MPVIQLEPGRLCSSAVRQVVWRSVQVAAGILLVVVPFGYAITPVHDSVMMAAGAGFAVGVGLNLRMGDRGGRSTGILIGSGVGIIIAFLAGLLPAGLGFLFVIGPSLPLAVGLCDGLGASRTGGYREATLESLTIAALLGLGLCSGPIGWGAIVMALACVPTTVLVAGFFSRDGEGRRHVRPPVLLIAAVLAEVGAAAGVGMLEGTNLETTLLLLPTMLLIVPATAFLSARAAAAWLRPRLQVYLQLADYLRVMWIRSAGSRPATWRSFSCSPVSAACSSASARDRSRALPMPASATGSRSRSSRPSPRITRALRRSRPPRGCWSAPGW